MPTTQNAHEKCQQLKIPTTLNAHGSKCPRLKMPKIQNAHDWINFRFQSLTRDETRGFSLPKPVYTGCWCREVLGGCHFILDRVKLTKVEGAGRCQVGAGRVPFLPRQGKNWQKWKVPGGARWVTECAGRVPEMSVWVCHRIFSSPNSHQIHRIHSGLEV